MPRRSRIETFFAALPGWQAGGIAFLAGAFAALGYAPLFLAPAFAVGCTVLVWLLDAAREKAGPRSAFFFRGWAFGAGNVLAGMYWISSPFMVDPNSWGLLWAVPATAVFCGGLGLFWGLGALFASFAWTQDVRRIAVFAAAFGLSEFLRGTILTGFPWNLPGYIWEAGGPISQTAAFVGIYGLSLITLLLAASPAALADGAASSGRRFAPLIAGALVLGLLWGAGAARLERAPVAIPGETPVVRVAESGLSQAEKWEYREDQEWRVLARYLRATGPSEESRASIVIWPEGAIPTLNFFLLENPAFYGAIGQALGDRALILGFSRRGFSESGVVLHNSAGIIDGVAGQARVAPQVYDKHHLVPFGEYIPFWPQVSALVSTLNSIGLPLEVAPLQRIGEGFAPGAPPARLIVPDAPPAAVLICYEAIFPGMTPRGEGRPGWIVNVTNDAWFGAVSGPQQHFNIARYRAIEEGLPMARAASGGISAIVDSMGRIERATDRSGGFAEAQLPRPLPGTVFSAWGFLLTGVLFAAIAALRLAPAGVIRGNGK